MIVFSCTEADDMASYNHSENIQYGAVLRTIEIQNSLINTSFDDSAFRVTVEEQDIEDGDLLQEMRIIAVFDDYTPDNGVTEATGLVQTVPAADFYTDRFGFPRYDIAASWGAIKQALNFTGGEFEPGDIVRIELELELTDGRVFGAADFSNYFKFSPYRLQCITCLFSNAWRIFTYVGWLW